MSPKLRAIVTFLVALVCLQSLDYLLTWRLLGTGEAYEANPVARYILQVGGWGGLALFKVSVTLIALAATLGVARSRPIVAVRLLAVFCLLMAGVNVYSGVLLASSPSHLQKQHDDNHLESEGTRLQQAHAVLAEFFYLRGQLCQRLIAGKVELPEALLELADLLRQFAPRIRKPPAAAFPDPNRSEAVAAYLDHDLRVHFGRRADAVRHQLKPHLPTSTQQAGKRKPLPPRP